MESYSFECETCQLRILGYTNFQRHANSIEHVNQVQMKISNNVTDEEKVFTLAECEEPTSTFNQYPSSSLNLVGLACDLCQKRFSGKEPYQQHLASAGHKKKVGGLANPNVSLTTPTSLSQLRCKICDKDFSGRIPYEQHIVSKAHKKKAVLSDMERKSFPAFLAEHQYDEERKNNYSLGSNFNDNSMRSDTSLNDVTGKPIKAEVAITPSFVASQLLLNCDVCDKNFSGPVPYQQHIDSQVHKKKVQEKEILNKLQNSSFKLEVDSTSSHDKIDGININDKRSSSLQNDFIQSALSTTSQVHPFRCEVCDKNFTGIVPYNQHMDSALHQKKMLQKNPVIGNTNIDIPNHEKYYCKICDKQCSGKIPFFQHEMSEAHCKKVQILNFNKKINDMSKLNDSEIADDQMSTDDNNAIETGERCNNLFPSSSDLSFSDVLKEINHVTPETLNVTTFGVADDIVF